MSESDIWPKDAPKAHPRKLLDTLDEIDPGNRSVQDAKTEYEIARRAVESPAPETLLKDMPEGVLDGWLGDVCRRRMARFPIAYAWPAMVTVASALVPRYRELPRFNLFTGLVGPWHSSKSQTVEYAQNLLRIEPPQLLDTLAGSAEALVRKCDDAGGNPRLFSPDELGHLLEKAQIQHASFAYILNRAFYHDKFEVLMGKGQVAMFRASLSIIGGLVEEKFQDLFGAATIGGLYDRFIFGACPGGFRFEYFPYDDSIVEDFDPVPVSIDEDVWVEKTAWSLEDPELEPRIAEIAIRVAAVCASFDGRKRLCANDLGPARIFADYQKRIRRLLKPNAGENFEGRVDIKILDYLDNLAGKFVSMRTMLRNIHAYRYGPSVADRALGVLHTNGEIEITKVGRETVVRRMPEFDPAAASQEQEP